MPWMAAASQFVSLVVIFYTLGKAVCEGGVCTNVLTVQLKITWVVFQVFFCLLEEQRASSWSTG